MHVCSHIVVVQSSQRPQIAIHWGEPERAPHKRYSCARIVYGAGGGTFVRPTAPYTMYSGCT